MDIKMTPEELRKEFESSDFRKIMIQRLGTKCVNCGKSKKEIQIDYHHIVPLCRGGTNKLRNIVPLCFNCHQAAHHSQNLTSMVREMGKSKCGGRPRIVPPDNYKQVLDDYMCGKMSQKRCKILLHIRGKSKLTDMLYYHDYLDELGIQQCRNHLDHIKDRDNMPPDRVISYIVYKNGKMKTFLADGSIIESRKDKRRKYRLD